MRQPSPRTPRGTETPTAKSPGHGERDEALEERRHLLRTQVWLAVSVLAVFVALTVLTAIPATTVLGTSLLVAAAATGCGALVGFLFGIPRILDDRSRPDIGAPTVSPNTNLEQISDWLTKILVGVGLVQFNTIGEAAGRLFAAVAVIYEPAVHATVLAATLIILPTVIGFVASYIGARTWLFEMFNQFDGGIASLVRHQVHQAMAPVRAEVDQVRQNQRTLRALLPVLDAQLDSRGPEPHRDVLIDALANATPAQRDHAFRTARQAFRAVDTDNLTRRRTIPVLQTLVDIEPDQHTYRGELGAALADIGEYEAALTTLDEAIARRGGPTGSDWYEFHRARARLGHTATLDPHTAALVRDDLAVTWQKPSFRTYVNQTLTSQDADDPAYQLLDRMRPYLPADAVLPGRAGTRPTVPPQPTGASHGQPHNVPR